MQLAPFIYLFLVIQFSPFATAFTAIYHKLKASFLCSKAHGIALIAASLVRIYNLFCQDFGHSGLVSFRNKNSVNLLSLLLLSALCHYCC